MNWLISGCSYIINLLNLKKGTNKITENSSVGGEKYQHYCAEHKISAEIGHLILVSYPRLKRHSKMIRTARGQSILQEKPPWIDWQSR